MLHGVNLNFFQKYRNNTILCSFNKGKIPSLRRGYFFTELEATEIDGHSGASM